MKIKTPHNSETEEIPRAVIEQLKQHPEMQKFINDIVMSRLKEQREHQPVPQQDKEAGRDERVLSKNIRSKGNSQVMKSPSDTTIYKPALMKGASESNEIINKISNFVEGIRIQSSSRKQTPDQRGSHKVRDEAARTSKEMGYDASPSTSAEQEAAEKVLIDAEQFKAKL